MSQKIYNTLVRDKFPELIAREGGEATVRTLDDHEFESKLLEHAEQKLADLKIAKTKEEIRQKISEIIESLFMLATAHEISGDSITLARLAKLNELGSFDKRIFLLSGDLPDNIKKTL